MRWCVLLGLFGCIAEPKPAEDDAAWPAPRYRDAGSDAEVGAEADAALDGAADAEAPPLDPACGRVEPASMEFFARPGEEIRHRLLLADCPAGTLPGPRLSVVGDAFWRSMPPVVDVAPDGSYFLDVELVFGPSGVGDFRGELVVGDPENPMFTVPLLGHAREPVCPVADAGPDQRAALTSVVTLLARDVLPADLAATLLPVTWEWVVVARPEGSVAQPLEDFFNRSSPADGGLNDAPGTPYAVLFADLEGRYVFELRMRGSGCDSVDQVAVDVSLGLEVELTWVGDADLDLHLHDTNGEFGRESDCWDDSPRPDWLPGGGPGWSGDAEGERIVLWNPGGDVGAVFEPGYGLGVDFVEGTGPIEATLRVRILGELVREVREILAEPGDFWEVGRLTWPDGAIRPPTP